MANTLVTANWFIGAMGGLAMTLLVIRTRTEEAHLLRRFGDDYARYTRRTGRFVPRVPARHSD